MNIESLGLIKIFSSNFECWSKRRIIIGSGYDNGCPL